ncbi:MAG: radical SAM protein [Planctomycetota bacterium]
MKLKRRRQPEPFSFQGRMRFADYRTYLEQAVHHPVVHIELTSKCNFHCYYCISPDSPRVKGFMEPAVFEHILPQLDGFTKVPVRLHIDGEPTLHPQFHRFARALNDAGHRVALATNGSALRPEYLDLGMNLRIYVSTDADALQRRSTMKFVTYVEKLADYVRAWRDSPSEQQISLFFYFDLSELQAGDDPLFQNAFVVDFLRRAGFDAETADGATLPFDFKKPNGFKLRLRHQPIVRGGVYSDEGTADLRPSDQGFCDSAWKTLAITAEGRLTYCCMDLTAATAYTEPDDLLQQPLRDLWLKHPTIQRVREETLRAHIANPTCQDCLAGQDYCQNREMYVEWGPEFTPGATPQ